MNRLKYLRKSRNLTQDDIADIMHCSSMNISRWERGLNNIPSDELFRLSEFFGVSIDYILGKSDETQTENVNHSANVPSETHKIPIVGSVACSWDEGFLENFDGEYTYINDYYHDKYGDVVRGIYARGDSMVDMISPGDLLLVIPAYDVENNDIVIATICGDEITAKKFHYNDSGGFDLIPVNSIYNPQSFSAEQVDKLPVKITGRVIEIRKGLRA